jgi:cellulose synthase/poly-beta-1,6-N-acetylglucosamine synthase-like glycosyltransferase
VNENLPAVTVIIPARPGEAEVKAVTASRALDYPKEKLEIILARGKQPSAQRNAAIKAARGDLLYFLDDDSIPPADNLRRAVEHFRDPNVQMVGGPNLCPSDAPALERTFALVLGSWLAFGPSRARYLAVGATRNSSEKELILCNLASRRQAMIDAGGFNEALYPNEENALMDEIQKKGGKLIYDPQFFVHRRPRSNLGAFARMLRTYGRGRAEQFRLHPTPGSALNFVPPAFCVYLVTLPLTAWFLGMMAFLPLAAYALVVLVQAALLATRGGPVPALGAVPLIVMTHVLYGLGVWRGMFTSLAKPQERSSIPVQLEIVTLRAAAMEGSATTQS